MLSYVLTVNWNYGIGRKGITFTQNISVTIPTVHFWQHNWKKEDNIKQRHQNKSADCPFVQDEVDNLSRYQSNVIFDRPKHPQFALLNDRLKTYVNWPADKKQTPQILAEAGFYHTGETDTVICYCCDGGLCNWDEEDDPWIEHTRWYPRCTYVRQRKGDQFVNSVKRNEFSLSTDSNHDAVDDANKIASPPLTQGSTLNSDVQISERDGGPKISQSIRKSPTVLAVLELGYEENIVEYVIKKKIKETGSAFAKASLLLEAVVKHIDEAGPVVSKDQQEELEEQHEALVNPENQLNMDDKLREENRLLKEQKTCKICLDNDLSIVFLPCGHFVSCATCAPSLKNCPLCRSQIMGLVRTYMS
ncbi:BIRC7_8 [Acanthosepion pharaonis]|uniref:BIRC7_8 n=1 Tax=Acanthosepion pharaonis TaxID=158019 RepID=A0A812EJQ3_ACAPH|nr:BIRC7_8 [Sepia pharaonis]